MRNVINILGILLIIVGIILLVYKGYTYTKHEPVAEIGDIQVVEDTQKIVYISPWPGALSLAAGVVLVVVARRGGKQ